MREPPELFHVWFTGVEDMEVTKQEFTAEDEREIAIAEHNTCCLCGSDLKFEHKIDFGTLTVVEDAHCPSCRIQLRQRNHILN